MYPGVGTFVLIRPAQTFYERINVNFHGVWRMFRRTGCLSLYSCRRTGSRYLDATSADGAGVRRPRQDIEDCSGPEQDEQETDDPPCNLLRWFDCRVARPAFNHRAPPCKLGFGYLRQSPGPRIRHAREHNANSKQRLLRGLLVDPVDCRSPYGKGNQEGSQAAWGGTADRKPLTQGVQGATVSGSQKDGTPKWKNT